MSRKHLFPLIAQASRAAILMLVIALTAMSGMFVGPATAVQAVSGCDSPPPSFDAANFKDAKGKPFPINNPYLMFLVGTTFTYEGIEDGQPAVNTVQVTRNTKTITINGATVTATVINDQVFLNGKLAEKTFDWVAQDKFGNVWYFGEDTKEYDPDTGQLITTFGSWEAGVNGQPGILMEATPNNGDTYFQEHAPGIAEDVATNVSTTKSVSVPYGSFNNVLETKEWSCLESASVAHKYYARGTGLLMEDAGGHEHYELTKIETSNH